MSLLTDQTGDLPPQPAAGGLWRNRGFVLLFSAQVISLLGSGITTVGLALFAYELTGGKSATSVVLHLLRHRWTTRTLLLGGLLLGAILLPGVLLPPMWLFALLWVLNGVGQALVAIPSSVLLAEHTAEHERGRAYAAHFALTHACWLFTYPAIGYAATTWGAPMTFSLAGLICLATTALAFLAGRGSQTRHTPAL